MAKVFKKESAKKTKKQHVELSDGRMMPLEDLVRDYERFLKEFISEEKDGKVITKKLKVGEWFRIDRNVIDKNRDKIFHKCIKEGTKGKKLLKRFEKSNKIADKKPYQYPRIIETYIFEREWEYEKSVYEMQDMCKQVGEGMCDEVICDFELQMRICNGELVRDLIQKADKLPCVRVIKLRNGQVGYFGGGVDNNDNAPPTDLFECDYFDSCNYYVPYAFRRVLS